MTDPTGTPNVEIGNGGTGGDGGNAVVSTQIDVTSSGDSSAVDVTGIVTHTEVGSPGTDADGTSNIVILPDGPDEFDLGAPPADAIDVHPAYTAVAVDYWIV